MLSKKEFNEQVAKTVTNNSAQEILKKLTENNEDFLRAKNEASARGADFVIDFHKIMYTALGIKLGFDSLCDDKIGVSDIAIDMLRNCVREDSKVKIVELLAKMNNLI